MDLELLRVVGGERPLKIGKKTVRALDRYLRLRSQRRDAELPWLWLGIKGRISLLQG